MISLQNRGQCHIICQRHIMSFNCCLDQLNYPNLLGYKNIVTDKINQSKSILLFNLAHDHHRSRGSVLDHRILPPWFESQLSISEGYFIFVFASLPLEVAGPFSLPSAQKWQKNTNHHHSVQPTVECPKDQTVLGGTYAFFIVTCILLLLL